MTSVTFNSWIINNITIFNITMIMILQLLYLVLLLILYFAIYYCTNYSITINCHIITVNKKHIPYFLQITTRNCTKISHYCGCQGTHVNIHSFNRTLCSVCSLFIKRITISNLDRNKAKLISIVLKDKDNEFNILT